VAPRLCSAHCPSGEITCYDCGPSAVRSRPHYTHLMSSEQQPKQTLMNRQLSVRGIGILALVGGTVIAYLSVVSPLLAASRHEESVTTSLKGAGITPLILALGIVYTFFPERAAALLGHPQKPTRLGWAFSLVFGLLGIPLYLWLKSRLREYGYGA